MKKTFLLFLLVLTASLSFANIIKIKVMDFAFKPKTVNAVVGDTILWQWQNGIHTTSSLTIPAGAKAWNAPMDSAHKKFRYILKVAGTYSYQCNFHFTVMKGTINVSTALASGLNNFGVGNDDNAGALLTWKTNSSKDVSYFSVQRSTDGDNFSEIARVRPEGINNFRYTDAGKVDAKYVYYQVAVVDNKGNRQLSEIQMFTNQTNTTSKLITSLSPNPVSTGSPHLMLQFNADKDGSMLVKLYSQNGTFIRQAVMTASKGLNNGHFHMGDLTPGTYYIVFTLDSKTEKHTVIVK